MASVSTSAGPSPLAAHAGEVRKLTTLLEVSQSLSVSPVLHEGIQRALDMLCRHHGVVRSAVSLLNEDTGDVELEASAGEAPSGRRAPNEPGEGMTGSVVQTGRPLVVKRVSRERTLTSRAADRPELPAQELSYICVPITVDGLPVGALGVDLRYKPSRDYDRSAKFLGVIGSMIGQAVKVHRLIEADRQKLVVENAHLRQELRERYDFSNLVGTSGPMRQVYEQIAHVAKTNTTVLLRGESGTGKELIAHAIHYNSARAAQPFIKVNCAALPHDLIESELFGYEKGAFTGAQRAKKGRFELAAGGTLFLDEIGETSLSTQVKLLRVLQEREFERLGSTTTIRTDIRIITATNKDLERAIAAREFREDLYYRLNVFAIFVPPLRERRPDVLLLADHFLETFSREHGKSVKRISTPAIDMLANYHWPGNVRELSNVIERAVVLCESQVLHPHHLPPTLQTAEATHTEPTAPLSDALQSFEKAQLEDALKSARGNRAKASRIVGTTERIFYYRVKKYGIDWKRFKI